MVLPTTSPAIRSNAAELLTRAAARRSERAAIIETGRTTTYGELRRRAADFQCALEASGVRPGDRVALRLQRGADAVAAYFGALAAGAMAVIVNEGLRPRQIEHILRHAGAKALVTTSGLLDRFPRRLDTAAKIIDAKLTSDGRGDWSPVDRIGEDAAQIIYTSGSTGPAKGVVISHANLRAGVDAVIRYLGLGSGDRFASVLPFGFDYGLNQLLCAIAVGAPLVVERSPVPQRIVATLRDQEVTVLAGVPPLWLQLLSVPEFRDRPIDSLRVMTNTGARLPARAVRALRESQPDAGLYLMYGLTEAFRSTYLPPEQLDQRPDSIGRAIPGAEVLVLADDGTPCLRGQVGELVHRGPTVALGYWDDPEATARVFRPNPLRPEGMPDTERVVFSGDLVRRDQDGYLHFVGRRDRMIKTLGYRVSPDEVTEVLYESGQVDEAVIATEPDDVRGARIIAHVDLSEHGRLERLESFCRAELPRHMRPVRFATRRKLRRTASGKHATPSSSTAYVFA